MNGDLSQNRKQRGLLIAPILSQTKRVTRPIRHYLGAIFLYSIGTIFNGLPLSMCQKFGQAIGSLIYVCTRGLSLFAPHQQTLVETQLTIASESLGLSTLAEIRKVEHAHWRDLGRRLGEWLAGKKALVLFQLSDELLSSLREIEKRSRQGSPQVMITAHYGHWELLAGAIHAHGFKFSAVAAYPKAGPLGQWLSQKRESLGVKTIHPCGGAKILREKLHRGEIVALLVDQSTKDRSIIRPFLGHLAPMSLSSDRLIDRFGAEPHWLISTFNSTHYDVKLHSLHPLNVYDQSDHSLSGESSGQLSGNYVVEAHSILEQELIKAPEQWVWIHQRWRRR